MNKTIKDIATGMLVASILTAAAFAATTNDVTSGGSTIAAGLVKPVVLTKTIDFATYNCAAFDVNKVITIPSNFFVIAVFAECVTTNTGTASAFVVGDATATNTFRSTTISMVLPDAALVDCTNAYRSAGGKLYTSPDFVSIVPTVAITDGKAKVSVLGVQL